MNRSNGNMGGGTTPLTNPKVAESVGVKAAATTTPGGI